MKRFATVIKQAGDRLQVPEPSRSRILLEIAADLEDSYRYFLDQGCEESEAARRAEESFATSEESLQHLAQIHETNLEGLSSRITQQIGTLWSKLLLTIILIFEVLVTIRIFTDHSFFHNMSPFMWPIGALALAAFLFTIWKFLQIQSRSGGDVRRLRTGLSIPLFFAGSSLAIAGLGLIFHLQRFFRINAAGAPEELFMNFAGWMISISSLMTVGILTAIFSGFVWYVLSRSVTRSETREIENLLQTAL